MLRVVVNLKKVFFIFVMKSLWLMNEFQCLGVWEVVVCCVFNINGVFIVVVMDIIIKKMIWYV